MSELKTGGKHRADKDGSKDGVYSERRLPLLFLGLLIISVIGYLTIRNLWVGFMFAHLGGFSIMGLFACLAGIIARKKNYSYRKAFLLGLFLPIILGLVGVLVIFPPNPELACGGSASLGTALLVVVFYSALKKKEVIK
jgi:hypothetical protein